MTWFEALLISALFTMCSMFAYTLGYSWVGSLTAGLAIGTPLGQLLGMFLNR